MSSFYFRLVISLLLLSGLPSLFSLSFCLCWQFSHENQHIYITAEWGWAWSHDYFPRTSICSQWLHGCKIRLFNDMNSVIALMAILSLQSFCGELGQMERMIIEGSEWWQFLLYSCYEVMLYSWTTCVHGNAINTVTPTQPWPTNFPLHTVIRNHVWSCCDSFIDVTIWCFPV